MVPDKTRRKPLPRHPIFRIAVLCSLCWSLRNFHTSFHTLSTTRPESLLPTNPWSSSYMTGIEVGSSPGFQINRIFYSNSFVSMDKNQKMKEWLSSQHISFIRLESIGGPASAICLLQVDCQRNTRDVSTYSYLLQYGGFQGSPSPPDEFTTTATELENLPWGNRPNYTIGTPFFNLTGTSLVLHNDNIVISHTDQLEHHLAVALESGQIASEWEVIRLKCCSVEETTDRTPKSNFSLSGMETHDASLEAVLWKDSALQRLATTIDKIPSQRFDRRIVSSFHTYTQEEACFCHRRSDSTEQSSIVRKVVPPEEPKVSLLRIQQQAPARKGPARNIDRVYFSNLEKNVFRNTMMNFWLDEDRLRTVPYTRINARVGDPARDKCIERKSETKLCRGIAGLSRTLLHILENEPTNGTSLILEDDYFITDPGFRRMEASLAMVPDDWDVIRFDCRDIFQVNLQWLNPFVARTNRFRARKNSTRSFFCGGTHAMLVREESVSRLKSMWGQTPFDDVDCIIGRTAWINSYCVNIGVGDMLHLAVEGSDIPKEAAGVGARNKRTTMTKGDVASHRLKAAFAEFASKQNATKALLGRMKNRIPKNTATPGVMTFPSTMHTTA